MKLKMRDVAGDKDEIERAFAVCATSEEWTSGEFFQTPPEPSGV
jgi:hypothetical protein